ncbi:MAG: YbaK/EbsC family protein [Brevefilum sp.]|nr:YbaK/EbsC family protein [Brevefilum sp.]MDT8382668.1 YbaK/EbsC family protein [Brevefilum sp.]MDW7755221.1 YbaK/EbsC family protein [Brevefilum sp.]
MTSDQFGEIPEKVKKVLGVLIQFGYRYDLRFFNQCAHHARQAAELLKCPLGAVVKSLVFENEGQAEFILVLASGQNRVDIKSVSNVIGGKVLPAKPESVLTITGFPVGAVPPFGVEGDPQVIIDADLLTFREVWAAAGSANYLMGFESRYLQKLTQGNVYNIKES